MSRFDGWTIKHLMENDKLRYEKKAAKSEQCKRQRGKSKKNLRILQDMSKD